MGTPNYFYRDTLYAADIESENAYAKLKGDIKQSLVQFEELGTSLQFDGETPDPNKNYGYAGLVLIECNKVIELENILSDDVVTISAQQLIIIRDGNYVGMNLDRSMSLTFENKTYNCECGLEGHIFDILEEIQQDDLFDIKDRFDNGHKYDHYIENDIYLKLSDEIDETQDDFDKIYHTLGKEHFVKGVKTAQFSNGEAMYAVAKT